MPRHCILLLLFLILGREVNDLDEGDQFESEEGLQPDQRLHDVFEHFGEVEQQHHRHCNQRLVLLSFLYLYDRAVLEPKRDNEATRKLACQILNDFAGVDRLLVAGNANEPSLSLLNSL